MVISAELDRGITCLYRQLGLQLPRQFALRIRQNLLSDESMSDTVDVGSLTTMLYRQGRDKTVKDSVLPVLTAEPLFDKQQRCGAPHGRLRSAEARVRMCK